MNTALNVLTATSMACAGVQADSQMAETGAQYNARMAGWREARFGMFIHWGPVSLKGTEIGWSRGNGVPIEEYDNLYKQFNPVRFNAEEWVKVARDAGMKYIVLTTRHHDGFCLWNTRTTDYNIMNTPFGRDVLKELAEACRKQGILYGSYYSILDWRHPDYPVGHKAPGTHKPDMVAFDQYIKDQLAEQVKQYGPISVFWFDGEWEEPWTHEFGVDLYRYLRRIQPDAIINNRVDKGRQGMTGTTTSGFAGDFDTPEQQVGNFNLDRPWEACMTMCTQWSWKPNDEMKSLQECLHTLLRTVGGDGNLLFNVGPMSTGEIEPRQAARLKEMGAWLAAYGSSIYGTRGGPFKPGPYGVSTRKGNTIYLHLMSREPDTVTLPAIPARIIACSALTGGTATVKQTDTATEVTLPAADRQEIDSIIALELDRPAMEIEPR